MGSRTSGSRDPEIPKHRKPCDPIPALPTGMQRAGVPSCALTRGCREAEKFVPAIASDESRRLAGCGGAGARRAPLGVGSWNRGCMGRVGIGRER